MKPGTVIRTFTSKNGNTVVFRMPESGDLDGMLAYANAMIDEDTYILLSGKRLTREYEQTFLDGILKKVTAGELIHVVVEVNGRYAGNASVDIGKYRKNGVGHVGLGLLKEFRQEGIGTELLHTLVEESRKRGLRLLTLSCFENNPRALHVYEKLGFRKSGITPGAIAWKGGYVGEVNFYLPLTEEP